MQVEKSDAKLDKYPKRMAHPKSLVVKPIPKCLFDARDLTLGGGLKEGLVALCHEQELVNKCGPSDQ